MADYQGADTPYGLISRKKTRAGSRWLTQNEANRLMYPALKVRSEQAAINQARAEDLAFRNKQLSTSSEFENRRLGMMADEAERQSNISRQKGYTQMALAAMKLGSEGKKAYDWYSGLRSKQPDFTPAQLDYGTDYKFGSTFDQGNNISLRPTTNTNYDLSLTNNNTDSNNYMNNTQQAPTYDTPVNNDDFYSIAGYSNQGNKGWSWR